MSILAPYIAALAERTGLGLDVSADDSFVALLRERRLAIETLEGGQALLFYMELGRPSSFRRNEILANLLGANLFLAETRGAALSYDAVNERVGLNLIVPLRQLEIEGFINIFENLMTAGEAWGNRLNAENVRAEERVRQALDALDALAPLDPLDPLDTDADDADDADDDDNVDNANNANNAAAAAPKRPMMRI